MSRLPRTPVALFYIGVGVVIALGLALVGSGLYNIFQLAQHLGGSA